MNSSKIIDVCSYCGKQIGDKPHTIPNLSGKGLIPIFPCPMANEYHKHLQESNNNESRVKTKNFDINEKFRKLDQIIKLSSIRGLGDLEKDFQTTRHNLLNNLGDSVIGIRILRKILNWDVYEVDLNFAELEEKVKEYKINKKNGLPNQDNFIKNNAIYIIDDEQAKPYSFISREIGFSIIEFNKKRSRFPIHYIHEGLHVHFSKYGKILHDIKIQEALEEVIIELIIGELALSNSYLKPFYLSLHKDIAEKLLRKSPDYMKKPIKDQMDEDILFFHPYYSRKYKFNKLLKDFNISFNDVKFFLEQGKWKECVDFLIDRSDLDSFNDLIDFLISKQKETEDADSIESDE